VVRFGAENNGEIAGQILGAMGAGAIVIGGLVALSQARLKLLIAYSTVAQIGYLFLIFPLAREGNALTGGILQAISHAFAKAAMFMAAGLMAGVLGHDRIADLRGIGRALPVTAFAFVLAAASLVGVPPSGGFARNGCSRRRLPPGNGGGQRSFELSFFAGGYMFRAFAPALTDSETPLSISARIPEPASLSRPGFGDLRF
jgi:hypothetical protein